VLASVNVEPRIRFWNAGRISCGFVIKPAEGRVNEWGTVTKFTPYWHGETKGMPNSYASPDAFPGVETAHIPESLGQRKWPQSCDGWSDKKRIPVSCSIRLEPTVSRGVAASNR